MSYKFFYHDIPTETLYLHGDSRSGIFPFNVEPFSEDFTGRLSWRIMGNTLLRCASKHAAQHGFGFIDMQVQHHAWVLSRLVVDLNLMPRTGEAYTVETWVGRIYRQFTDRFFALTSPFGRTYGFAFSTWALIDVTSRQPKDLTTLPDGGFSDALIDKGVPIDGPGRIRLKNAGEPVATHTACYTDLDVNGHVNSIRYIELLLDLFPPEAFQAMRPPRIEVAYCAEAYAGDELSIFSEALDGGKHLFEIRKADGQCVVKAAILFR